MYFIFVFINLCNKPCIVGGFNLGIFDYRTIIMTYINYRGDYLRKYRIYL